VKGVTGIAQQSTSPYTKYTQVLKNVELNSEVVALSNSCFSANTNIQNIVCSAVTTIGQYSFAFCSNLSNIVLPNGLTVFTVNAMPYCMKLAQIEIPSTVTEIGSTAFYYDRYLQSVIIPSTVTNIGSSAFSYCASLEEVHCQAIAPPTIGNNVFFGLPNNFIIYVPVGAAETYKAASRWSTYADHIVEEGQTLSMAALRRIQAEKDDNGEEMR
jgi:hypothetical protein